MPFCHIDTLAHIANKTMILDWYQLHHKWLELSRR
jgi:hypothetical protein